MPLRDSFRAKKQELKTVFRRSPTPDRQARTAPTAKETIIGAVRKSLELTEKLSGGLPPLQMAVQVLGAVLDMYEVRPMTAFTSLVYPDVLRYALVRGVSIVEILFQSGIDGNTLQQHRLYEQHDKDGSPGRRAAPAKTDGSAGDVPTVRVK